MPETSIVIRTLNEEQHLDNLLRAIREQDYRDYEIIVVDSGSTDKTLEIARDFADSVLEIEKQDFTFGYSLNIGCHKSRGKYIVLISAHALPRNNQWLGNLLVCFKNEKIAMVYGKQLASSEGKFSEKRDLQRIFGDSPLNSNVFLGYANNANSALRRDLWQKHPFDEYLFGLEDIEWAKYATSQSFLVHYEPKAAIYHIHNEKWPQIFNRYRREAIAAAKMGLSRPCQAKTNFFWLAENLFKDCLASLPNISWSRLEEIFRFRYYQWKGTRQGWFFDKDIDINKDKYELFYPAVNKAVVIKNKKVAGIEDMPLSVMKPGDVLIRVKYVGVCQTDLEVYDGTLGYYKAKLAHYPIVPGHEFSGEIIKIGPSNTYRERFKLADCVVGECILSRDDKKRKEVGVINYNGAYSEFIVMPVDHLHKIPKGLDLKTACLAEPLAVVLRALKRLKDRIKSSNNFAVVGAGPIGNLCSQWLLNSGYQVTVFDKNKERLDILTSQAIKTSRTIDNLGNFDVIIEATGSKEVLEKILRESKGDSTLLLLGFPYGSLDYNFEDIVGREKVIIGSVGGGPYEFDEALRILPKLNTAAFTQTVLPLKDFSRAWEVHNSQKHLKIILKP